MSDSPPLRPKHLRRTARKGVVLTTPVSASALTTSLELRLFGPMEIRIGEQPLPHLRSRKGFWLLALLALRKGRDVGRDWLAGTLWPDSLELHALRSLRQSVYDLRLALGPSAWRLGGDGPRTLRLDLRGVFVDALEFDAAIERGDPESLELAVQLYRGPLLEDCSEEWAVDSRRGREQAFVGALETLARTETERGRHGEAANQLRAALRVDPFREDLQRSLMESLVEDGCVAAALLVYREYRALLGREMAAEPAEETTLYFRQLRDETRASATVGPSPAKPVHTPAAETSTLRRTLPIPLTPLIGRESEVAEVRSLAASTRLLTLTGSGGVGKTRLAIQSAEEMSPDFPDGAVFADLSPLESPDLVPDSVRIALNAPANVEDQDPIENLARIIGNKKVLVVLDNCEHLGSACGDLAQGLLSRCPHLRILATSRQTLGVKGESVWRVPSLAMPKTGPGRFLSASDVRPVSEILEYPAVRLFAERARSAQSSFAMTHRTAVSIVKICNLLDGIPLAIELAAARVNVMTTEKIAERLNDRLRFLLGDKRSRKAANVSRQETLRASIDWSYNLLSEKERVLLQRLSVFSGGWTLEAAEAICSTNPLQEWEVLDLIGGLVEKSLVVYLEEKDRYRMLETIRQYLKDRGQETGEGIGSSISHLKHFLSFAEEADVMLEGSSQVHWLDLLELEHDNLRAALSFSIQMANGAADSGNRRASQESELTSGVFALRLAYALGHFWRVRGYLAEGRSWLRHALERSGEPTVYRCKALNAAGTLAFRQGDYHSSKVQYDESLAIVRQLGNDTGIASLLNNLGMLAYGQEDFGESRRLFEEALEIRRKIGDRLQISASLNNVGAVAYHTRDLKPAAELYRESLEIRRELGDTQGIAGSLNNLAGIALLEGNYSEARSLHRECLPLRCELGDRQGIAECLEALAESEREWLDAPGGLSTGTSDQLRAAIRAAELLGAADGLREGIGAPRMADDRIQNERLILRLQEILDADAYASARTRGKAMDLNSAVEKALG